MVLSTKWKAMVIPTAVLVFLATACICTHANGQEIGQILLKLASSGKLENATQTTAGFMGHTLCEGVILVVQNASILMSARAQSCKYQKALSYLHAFS